MDATEPLEQSLAFPTIEWTLDDDESDHEECEVPLKNDELLPSYHSAPFLGNKRPRLEHHSGLVRSMSLKSSLCYLAEQSVSPSRRSSIRSVRQGSWGQFIFNDEVEHTVYKMSDNAVKEFQHLSTNGMDQIDICLSPFLVCCAHEANGLE